MSIIPVIDLLRGSVVRAVRGDRSAYRSIESALCGSAEPVAVAARLQSHVGAKALYLADLDALQGGAVQVDVLAAVLASLPGIELWLDAGFGGGAAVDRLRGRLGRHGDRVVPVFGSESIASAAALQDCLAVPGAVLSLDRRDGVRLDAAGAWDRPGAWPRRVIVMTLESVGADAGPDLATLAAVRSLSPATELVGAGGIRHEGDLDEALRTGASAWLVASALHDLRIPAARR